MSARQAEAARNRWQAKTAPERVAATAAARERTEARRRVAFTLLAAAEAAGLVVAEESPS